MEGAGAETAEAPPFLKSPDDEPMNLIVVEKSLLLMTIKLDSILLKKITLSYTIIGGKGVSGPATLTATLSSFSSENVPPYLTTK